jgi:hypothetical protein
MPAGLYNFTIEEGADFALGLHVKINGEVQDLSAWDFAAQLRTTVDGTLLATFTTSLDPDNETLRIGLDSATTDNLLAQNARWDLLATTPDLRKIRLLEGKVTISGSVTEL